MVLPLTIESTAAGCARLDVALVDRESAVTRAFSRSPLRLLTPRSRGQSVWAFTSSFGGGYLAGDQTDLEVNVGTGARCFLSTQAMTKVYRSPTGMACGHRTRAAIAEGGLLVFVPDPVQPFAQSCYWQRQEWDLAPGAGLVMLDWYTCGRTACGERWEFTSFESRNDVFCDGQRVFLDALRLQSGKDAVRSRHRTGRYACFATLLVMGTPVACISDEILADVGTRPAPRDSAMVCAASPIRHGALLRLAGECVEAVGKELAQHLKPLSECLGDDPWRRKW